MSVFINNANADTMSLTHFQLRDAEVFLDAPQSSIPGGGGGGNAQNPYTPFQNDSFTSAMVKTTPGHVYSFSVINVSGGDRFLQLHDSAVVPNPGDTPEFKAFVPQGGAIGIGTDIFGPVGKVFLSGIAVGNSTTSTTFTAGVVGDLLLDLFYDGALTTSNMLLENGFDLLLENGVLILLEA